MEIEDPGGHTVATVKKALITPLRDRWTVTVADGPDLDVKGNIVDHEYTIEDGRSTVAEVSKKWFRIADTYGVEVAPGQKPRADAGRHGRPGPDGARGTLTLSGAVGHSLGPLHGIRRHPGPSLAGPGREVTAGWGSVAGGVGAAGVRVADSVRMVM